MADLRTYPGGVIYAKPQCGGLSLTPEGLYMRNPSVAELAEPRWGSGNSPRYNNLGEVELSLHHLLNSY
jgi:hypothetical protein